MASTGNGYANANALVSTEWVAEHLKDPKVRVVESNEDILLYDVGHVPGAVKVDWHADLNDPVTRDFVGPEAFATLAARLGIGPETTVVFYGDRNNWWAAYAYWLFKLYGHRECRIMDGGRAKWIEDGRELTKEIAAVRPTTYPTPEPNGAIRAFQDDVLAFIGGKRGDRAAKLPAGRALVDVRSPGEYSGQVTHMPDYPQEGVLRGGHIPGAGGQPRPDLQERRGAQGPLRREGRDPGQGRGRLLPHRRALQPHLVRPPRAARLPARQELRRLLDRVGQLGPRADREVGAPHMRRIGAILALIALVPAVGLAQSPGYEVWAVDQADANRNGARLYVYRGPVAADSAPEVVDLDATSRGVGAGPGVRPHLLLFNKSHSHGVLAWVASGHVTVIRASDRKTVASIDVGEQAHGAAPAPDDSFLLVANQNGKKLARIKSDFAAERFAHEAEADLDLKALENPDQPDNAPICPLLFVEGTTKAYVTMRGGGLYVVDAAATPIRVLKTFTKAQVAPSGCGGIQLGAKLYINSGTATFGALYVFDTETDNLVTSIDTTRYGTDAHGMALVGDRYVWMANRAGGDNVVVFDARTDEVVGTFAGFGAAPDLIDVAPAGDRAFVTLRGPNNLTGGPAAKGETPGLAVLDVRDGGRTGARAAFVPIGAQGSRSDADPHALAVRRLSAGAPVQVPTQLPRTGGPAALLLGLGLTVFLAGAAVRRLR
jgi:thiosulfate/3-mercaptopyruvate sulfurtransferase